MKRVTKIVCVAGLALTLTACKDEDQSSPDETYRGYYAKVIAGRSFDEDVTYHAKSRQEEVLGQLEARSQSSGQSAEVIQNMYLNFTQSLAKCGTLELKDEVVDGVTARLVYAVTDTCNSENTSSELWIEMVDEDGWKIVSDELKIKDS